VEYRRICGYDVSRLGLGTVQFGVDYGVNNPSGRVPRSEVRSILETALERGVSFLDTSRIYGASEEVLGTTMRELGAQDSSIVCTKLDLPEDYRELSDSALLQATKDCVHTSLNALKLDCIPFYLTHRAEYKHYRDGIIWHCLRELQDEGLLQHLGASVGTDPDEARQYLADSSVEMLQIPYNALDTRWVRSGVLTEAQEKGVGVVTRSCYLQGLLLMGAHRVPRRLAYAREYVERLESLAAELSLPVKELAFRYVFSTSTVHTTVLGVDSTQQFRENLALAERPALPGDVVRRVQQAFADVPETVVNPALWPTESAE
jgi:aryl-alcohol dehydrogenase-like predicted oxidoreductase